MEIKNFNFYLRKILNEWLLIATILGFVSTSLFLKRFPSYSKNDFEVLFILFVLFVIVKGIENSNFFDYIALIFKPDRFIGAKLVIITSLLSMIITNDVALLIIVPLTLSLNIRNKDFLIILEAMSANAGSSLTPFGNPQNIFIYWFYHLHFEEFFKTIYPFTLFSLIIIILLSFLTKYEKIDSFDISKKIITLSKSGYVYIFFLILFILAIFHILPLIVGVIPLLYTLIFERKNFKIDYILIAIFFFFFGFTDNLKEILEFKVNNSTHVFLLSAFLSQFISNVPSALVFSDFTQNWKALLWGVNVGGYGNLIGSLANLIAYRIYVNRLNNEKMFAFKFNFICFLMFLFSLFLYIYIF